MSYADDSATYRDPDFRARAEMCIREQGYGFSADPRPDVAALAQGVVAGNGVDIDAILAGIVTAPGNENLDTDPALLAATQAVWPVVAAARYPQT